MVAAAAAAAKSLQSCPTLCDPIDGSLPGSSVPGILQARILEWATISFSNEWNWKGKVKSLSRARLSATPWTAACQAPPSMGFSRQEYWSGVPLPSPQKQLSCPQILSPWAPRSQPPQHMESQGHQVCAISLLSRPLKAMSRWKKEEGKNLNGFQTTGFPRGQAVTLGKPLSGVVSPFV